MYFLAVGGGYSSTFLTTMLQGKKTKECNPGYVFLRGKSSEDTARFFYFSGQKYSRPLPEFYSLRAN